MAVIELTPPGRHGGSAEWLQPYRAGASAEDLWAGIARAGRLAYAGGVLSREELPRFVAPMLARTGPMPVSDGWAVEVKFDGVRLQLRRDGGAVCLRSRPGRDCTEEFPELVSIQRALGRHRVLIDGELVCLGADGSPDFAGLRRRLRASNEKARRHAERTPATFLDRMAAGAVAVRWV